MTDDSGDTTNNFLKVNASAIDDTAEAIYGWDGTSYDIYDHDDDASGRPDLIAPGTGFFIYAASDTNVSFTEAMQVHKWWHWLSWKCCSRIPNNKEKQTLQLE